MFNVIFRYHGIPECLISKMSIARHAGCCALAVRRVFHAASLGKYSSCRKMLLVPHLIHSKLPKGGLNRFLGLRVRITVFTPVEIEDFLPATLDDLVNIEIEKWFAGTPRHAPLFQLFVKSVSVLF